MKIKELSQRRITFNTGRWYSLQGQRIVAWECGTPFDDIDWFGQETSQWIEFEDLSRGIKGKIPFCKLAEKDIMRNYDSGNYVDI